VCHALEGLQIHATNVLEGAQDDDDEEDEEEDGPHRITFMVNVWLQHVPADAIPLRCFGVALVAAVCMIARARVL
jgi:hypothetical protein